MNLTIKEFKDHYPYEELTDLYHKAYSAHLDENVSFAAVDQDIEFTKRRLENSLCIVAYIDDAIVGSVAFHLHKDDPKRKWYQDNTYYTVSLLAITPEYQSTAVPLCIGQHVRHMFKKDTTIGSLICDTALTAEHLVLAYSSMMQKVDFISWPNTPYYSIVFRFPLNGPKYSDKYCDFRFRLSRLICKMRFSASGKKRLPFLL